MVVEFFLLQIKLHPTMSHRAVLRRITSCSLLGLTLAFCPRAKAISFVTDPTFTPSLKAPLAGVLQVDTDVDSRVSVLVSDGTGVFEKDFYAFGTNHSEILLGFKPNETNEIQVTVYDKYRNSISSPQLLKFVTAPLPATFPTSVLLTNAPGQMEPGYTLFMIQNLTSLKNYADIVDSSGTTVWYFPWTNTADIDVRQLDDGNLFVVDNAGKRLEEIDMLGNIVSTWGAATNYPIDPHDGVPTSRGTILYLSGMSRMVTNFPSNDTNSSAPLVIAKVADNPVVEISQTNGQLLNVWSPMDILNDPTRVTYLTYGEDSSSTYGVDNEHANAVLEDSNDDSIIVSLRNQNAVFDFSRTNGQLKWILGPPANWSANVQPYLLTPVGAPFNWNYGQHAPMLTPEGTLVLFNDGIVRASPYDPPVADQNNHSSATEYAIDTTNMQVSQVWDSAAAPGDVLFAPILGKAQWLPEKRNVLATYGYVTYVNGQHPSAHSTNATMVRIREFTHDPVPRVVFDLSFFDYQNTTSTYKGYLCYRAERIPDLYAHPKNPVTDLVISDSADTRHLEFSADPTQTYAIKASSDLRNWTTIGTALQQGGNGDYYFDDLQAGHSGYRYYRVVTQPGM
jgi:hypothetical protein